MPQETENTPNLAEGLTVEQLFIPPSELVFTTTRASGPGGQYVNRTESAVQLRFDATHSPSLPEDVRQRLLKAVGSKLTAEGLLLIDVQKERSQLRNKELALEKLAKLLAKALHPPKKRIRTKPTAASKERRLKQKKRDSEIKKNRQKPTE